MGQTYKMRQRPQRKRLNMFYILNLTTQEPHKEGDEVATFASGDLARRLGDLLTVQTGHKHQPRRCAPAGDWRERERARFVEGHYTRPVWLDTFRLIEPPADHFLHVSTRSPGKIAFTQNDEKGGADIQTPMRVAAYLLRYCAEQCDEQLAREIAEIHAAKYGAAELSLATSAEEIVEVYRNGPSSCMSKDLSSYDSSIHLVAVYGSSDLALAYIRGEDEETISSRALVWPERKRYGRIYGYSEPMRAALEREGYEPGDFEGAKIRLLMCEDQGEMILPYLDGVQTVRVFSSEFLEITRRGDIYATETTGLAAGAMCERCECRAQGGLVEVSISRRRSEMWCDSCADQEAAYCDHAGGTIAVDCMVEIDGSLCADWVAEEEAAYCERSRSYTFEPVVEVRSVAFRDLDLAGLNRANDHRLRVEIVREDLAKEIAFRSRLSGKLWANECAIFDPWSPEPRALYEEPTDAPEDAPALVPFLSLDPSQLSLSLAA